MGKTILLTGRPRVGKTTIVKEVVKRLPGRAGGFYTEEIKERGQRQGFRIVTLDGQEGLLAHVNVSSRYRVSKYGVDLVSLEKVGVTAIQHAIVVSDYVVIDEIGKMELFSAAFKEAVLAAVESDKLVLGTIMLRSHPWADAIKSHPQVNLIKVTVANRDTAVHLVLDSLSKGFT
ncbi:MAG: NTPase [Anaerolineales bacterium]|nr:MAG: NTPase [Anaerolineales bacterium]